MNMVKGLTLYVYRDRLGDCSNGGISSRYDELILVGEEIVRRRLFGGKEEYLHIEPYDNEDKWYSYGGNIACASDSRFPSRYPLKIHDRREC